MIERPALGHRSGLDRALAVLLFAALFAFAGLLGFQKIRCFDYWWHLRTGALIVETGSVPMTDVLTYSVPGTRWVDIHWLHQLGVYGLYSLGGHDAVVLGKVAMAVLLTVLLVASGRGHGGSARPALVALAAGLALAVTGDRFLPRPELPSFVLLVAVLLLLDRHERRADAWVYAVVPLQLLWANLHGLFALGLAACAMYLAGELLRPVLLPGQSLDRPALGRLAKVLALSIAVSFANPNGLDGVLYPIQQLGMIGPPDERGVFGSLISELIPPIGSQRAMPPLLLGLVGSLAALSAGAMALNWRRVPAAHPLLWVAFGYLALGALRNLPLFALVAAPILVRNANEVLDRGNPWPRGRRIAAGLLALLLGLSAVDVARNGFFPRVGSLRETGFGTLDVFYPTGAVDWILQARPEGPIHHDMADGGYLAWRLWPHYKTLVDGRLEVYGPERFLDLVGRGVDHFKALDEKYAFGSILVHYSLFESQQLLWWLDLNPTWKLAYVDEVAAVFVHAERAGLSWLREVDLDDPRLLSREGPPGPSDMVRRLGRTNFWSSVHRFDRALASWEKTIAIYPDLPQARVMHASLLQRNGFQAAAEAILRELMAEAPDDPKLLVQIGDVRFEGGDRVGAREFYERALEKRGDFPYALLRRAEMAELDGDVQSALFHYTRVLALSPAGDPAGQIAAGRLAVLQGESP